MAPLVSVNEVGTGVNPAVGAGRKTVEMTVVGRGQMSEALDANGKPVKCGFDEVLW